VYWPLWNRDVVAYEYENVQYFLDWVTIEEFELEFVQEKLDWVQTVVVVYDDDDDHADDGEDRVDGDEDHVDVENHLLLLF
jgi:hypothetical protein